MKKVLWTKQVFCLSVPIEKEKQRYLVYKKGNACRGEVYTSEYAWETVDIQRNKSLYFWYIMYTICQVLSVPKLAVRQPSSR